MDYAKVFETIISETEKYLRENNLFAMILGVSGGLDSTVTAAICHEVEKRNPDIKFIGVSLPCHSNSNEENSSANICMEAFCRPNQYYTENIQKEYMLLRATCSQRHSMTTIGQGNIKARLRMTILYNEANYFSGCVIDTDNLTEHYLGFFTIHGDQGDFNPIGGLWKHEVYELAKYLLEEYYHSENCNDDNRISIQSALQAAIDITPTDGNGVNELGDMGQIAPAFANDRNIDAYTKVDDIIRTYLEYSGHHPEEFQIAMSELCSKYDTENKGTVYSVLNRVKHTEFKRKHLPISVKRELYDK